MEADTRSLSRAPRCRATQTLTALPIPIRKPVNRDTRIVVEPTAPKASLLENLPTTATSAMLNSTCKSWDSISGILKNNIFFQRDPSVILFPPDALPIFKDLIDILDTLRNTDTATRGYPPPPIYGACILSWTVYIFNS